MRIGVVGPCREDDFASNIVDGLRELGLSAHSLGGVTLELAGRRTRALADTLRRDPTIGRAIEQRLVKRACENELELVVTVVSLRPETIRSLTRNGIRTALWFPDAVSNLGALWMFDADYDAVFFKEPVLVRRLTALISLPIFYLPEACNPRIHRPVAGGPAAGTVIVAGSLHPIRARLVERLLGDGLPISIYGPPTDADRYPSLRHAHTRTYVRGLEKSALFRSASAVLNSLHPAEIEGVNCRLFEAAAAGATVVSEYRAELPRFFEVDREILAYQDYDSLVAHVMDVLDGDGLGQRIGDAASDRAMREHTYPHRLTELLERIA